MKNRLPFVRWRTKPGDTLWRCFMAIFFNFVSVSCKTVVFGILASAIVIFSASTDARAFCIYNDTPLLLHVTQLEGQRYSTLGLLHHGFKKYMDPGTNACCNWKDRDCNVKGGRGDKLKFRVTFEKQWGTTDEQISYAIDLATAPGPASASLALPIEYCTPIITAGGWFKIRIESQKVVCRGYTSNGWEIAKDGTIIVPAPGRPRP